MAQLQLPDALLQNLHQRASEANLSIDEMLQRWLNTPYEAASSPSTPGSNPDDLQRHSASFLTSVLESSVSGMMVFQAVRDDMGKITDFVWILVNRAMGSLINVAPDSMIGTRLLDLYPGDRNNGIFDHYVSTVESGKPRSFEQHFAPYHMWVTFSVIKYDDGVIVNYHDITRLKMSEAALREANENYEDLVERIPGMVYRMRWEPKSNAATYDYVSPRVRDFHGVEPEAVYADSSLMVSQLHPDDLTSAIRVGTISAMTMQPIVWEGRFTIGGKLRWLRREARPERMDDGSLIWNGIEIDITPEIEAREAHVLAESALRERERLEAMLHQEQRLSHTQMQLIRTVSHEFRTPLAIMTSSINILERYFERLEPHERLRRLTDLHYQIRQLTLLLDDTTDILRDMVHRAGFHPHPVNLEQLCEVILNQIQSTLGEQHRLRFLTDGQVRNAYIDDRLMSRVLVNLLTNAVKYSPPHTEIRLELMEEEHSIVLRVVDRGMGIAPEDVHQLFEPFFRAKSVEALPGTGLGLPIVKDCVELHGGRIEVDSVLQQGTTFTIYLPVTAVNS